MKLQYFGHLMRRVDSLEKTDAGRDWGQEEKGPTEEEMAGWHHWLDGRESEWTLGVGHGQGGLACCDSWGRKESDTTEQLNWTETDILSLWMSRKKINFFFPDSFWIFFARLPEFSQVFIPEDWAVNRWILVPVFYWGSMCLSSRSRRHSYRFSLHFLSCFIDFTNLKMYFQKEFK